MKALGPTDAERVKCEQAFDSYVDQWSLLRDQVIRPAQAKHGAATRLLDLGASTAAESNETQPNEAAWGKTVASAYFTIGNMERAMFSAMRETQSKEEQRATLDRIAAERARKRAGAVVRGVPLHLPVVPKVPNLAEEKRAAIEARKVSWEISATPLIERIAAASLDDDSEGRVGELKRKLISSERAAVRDIAEQLPAEIAQKYKAQFARRALANLSGWNSFASSPDSLRKRVAEANLAADGKKSLLDKIEQWQKQRDQMDESALDALVSDTFSAEALDEINSKFAQMNSSSVSDIAQAASMPELAFSNDSMPFSFEAGDGEGQFEMSDLENAGGAMVFTSVSGPQLMGGAGGVLGDAVFATSNAPLPEGAVRGTRAMMIITSSGEDGAANRGVSGNVSMNIQIADEGATEMTPELAEKIAAIVKEKVGEQVGAQVEARMGDQINSQIDSQIASQIGATMGQALAQSDAVREPGAGGMDAVADDFHPGFFGGLVGQFRPLGRQDMEKIRSRLSLSDAQRPVWDSLANDVLQSGSEWIKSKSDRGGNSIPGEDMEAMMKRSRERFDALTKLEESWFDDVASGVKGLDAGLIQRERHRRALVRAFAGVKNSHLPMPFIMMSRWSKVDLHAAVEALPAQVRSQVLPTVDACQASLLQELAIIPGKIDAFNAVQMSAMRMESLSDDAGHDKMQISMSMDDAKMAELEKARKPLMDAWKAVEQLQMSNVETVASKMDSANAQLFRRAVRKQTHPEVFRTQEKVDGAIERVIALGTLTPEQTKMVTALAGDFYRRADSLVERSIESTERNDAAVSNMMGGSFQSQVSDMAKQERAMVSTDIARSDASYDREELNSRAMRQLRAALTPEQAKASKVN